MAPKTTRRAFQPDKRTSAASPRKAPPARKGGNTRMAVSSSASTTLRGGKAARCPRICRFFLHVRGGVQARAGAFPDVPQTMSGAADGIVGKAGAVLTVELVLHERHGPIDCQI